MSRRVVATFVLVLATTAHAQTDRGLVGGDESDLEPLLESAEGPVRDAGDLSPFAPVDETSDGTFLLEAVEDEDVRVSPDALLLERKTGLLDAVFEQRNGVRNVDPATGWPRAIDSIAFCDGSPASGCLFFPSTTCARPWVSQGVAQLGQGDVVRENPDFDPACVHGGHADRAVERLCGAIGSAGLERIGLACPLEIASREQAGFGLPISEFMGRVLAGDPTVSAAMVIPAGQSCLPNNPEVACDGSSAKGSQLLPFPLPIVQLGYDPGDLESLGCTDYNLSPPGVPPIPCGGSVAPVRYLGATLSPKQEGALGCGPLFGIACDDSGVQLRWTDASALFQSWPVALGMTDALALKQAGTSLPGTAILDPNTGDPVPFRDPIGYRTDEGPQPGTLPWAAAGLSREADCSVEHLGGGVFPSGVENVPTGSGSTPPDTDEALPGCHRKWVDVRDGYINDAWGTPVFQLDGNDLVIDPKTGLPLQERIANPAGVSFCSGSGLTCNSVVIDDRNDSGDPDPLGTVFLTGVTNFAFPDQVFYHEYANSTVLFDDGGGPTPNAARPAIGPGHPFASRRATSQRPESIVAFASELAGLSWNFLMFATGFSLDFRNALETVGDLADPDRPGCNPGGAEAERRSCGAQLEGGSIDDISSGLAERIGAARRLVAQLLLAFCGSDYGVVNPTSGLGTCRIDDTLDPIAALRLLYMQAGVDPNDPVATQALQDTLQYTGVPLVQAEDARLDITQYDDNPPLVPERLLTSEHCSFVTPQHCDLVQAYASLTSVGEDIRVPAVSPDTVARRHWVFESGAVHEVVAATGEFAGHRRALAFGPFVSDPDGTGDVSETKILLEEPRLEERDLEQQNDALVTRDAPGDLDWLDPTLTAGLSVEDILAGVGGWTAAGWRHATTAEVCALFQSQFLGGTPCPGQTDDASAPGARAAQGLVQLLGQRFSGPTMRPGGLGEIVDLPTITASGFFLDLQGGVGSANYTAFDATPTNAVAVWSVTENVGDFPSATVGHFLVRAVPEPAAGWLGVAAGICIGVLRRRLAVGRVRTSVTSD